MSPHEGGHNDSRCSPLADKITPIVLIGILALALGHSACSGGDAPLVSADQARQRQASRAAADATAAAQKDLSGALMPIGSTGNFHWELLDRKTDIGVTVLSIRADRFLNFGQPKMAGLLARVRIENRSERVDQDSDGEKSIAFSIYCAKAPQSYQYMWDNSGAYSPGVFIVPGASFDEGTLLFGVPDGCKDDSVITAKVVLDLQDPPALRWAAAMP